MSLILRDEQTDPDDLEDIDEDAGLRRKALQVLPSSDKSRERRTFGLQNDITYVLCKDYRFGPQIDTTFYLHICIL